MTQVGISEADLKPGFLMLSSCETQLSKRARTSSGENTKTSLEHAQNSYRWLQKVYGEIVPQAETESNQAAIAKAKATASHHNSQSVQQTIKATTIPSSSSSLDRVSSASGTYSVPTKTSVDLAGDATLATTPNYIALANMARVQMLERELQSIRDRERNAASDLNIARSAKRKLEDDFHAERNLRRKLERKLNDVEGQLDISKKMENFALDQMKREVDARRRAEERAEGEREKRKEVEASLKARGSKPLFEDLADMFQRAAKGEGIVLPANLAGSSGLSRSSDK
jgi:hypothetical protein